MEILLGKRAVRQIRLSALAAIEEGDTDTLREDIVEAFDDDDIDEIERRIDSGEFNEFLSDLIEDWTGNGVDEFFEMLELSLADVDIEIDYSDPDFDEDENEDEDEDDGSDGDEDAVDDTVELILGSVEDP